MFTERAVIIRRGVPSCGRSRPRGSGWQTMR
ncbi:MAG: hypothetical protein C4558_05145 [Dehalococcoidia bacterium]|nr:MAG: hypothetical protein C4558_05145 [Dehalococcoidia bacterium]